MRPNPNKPILANLNFGDAFHARLKRQCPRGEVCLYAKRVLSVVDLGYRRNTYDLEWYWVLGGGGAGASKTDGRSEYGV